MHIEYCHAMETFRYVHLVNLSIVLFCVRNIYYAQTLWEQLDLANIYSFTLCTLFATVIVIRSFIFPWHSTAV